MKAKNIDSSGNNTDFFKNHRPHSKVVLFQRTIIITSFVWRFKKKWQGGMTVNYTWNSYGFFKGYVSIEIKIFYEIFFFKYFDNAFHEKNRIQ